MIDLPKKRYNENMKWHEHLKRCSAQYQAEKKANARGRAVVIEKPVRRVVGKQTLPAPTRRLRQKFRPGEDVDYSDQNGGWRVDGNKKVLVS